MTRQEAKERLATALRIVTANRLGAGGLPPWSDLESDIESWPLTRIGGDQPLTILEWFQVCWTCFRNAPRFVIEDYDRGTETTVGDLITAIQEANATPERRPEVRGM